MQNKKWWAEHLVDIKNIEIPISSICVDERVRSYCTIKYPNYKNGCPNYGKSPFCPPNSPFIGTDLQNYGRATAIYAEFDIQTYENEMGKRHPQWSKKQRRNPRLWQNTVKKMLSKRVVGFVVGKCDYIALVCGSGMLGCYSLESVGVNVISTMFRNGVKIRSKIKDKVYLVCIVFDKRVDASKTSRAAVNIKTKRPKKAKKRVKTFLDTLLFQK